MYQFQSNIRTTRVRSLVTAFALLFVFAAAQAQEIRRTDPTWWFGGTGAANLNFYGGTTQMLNSGLSAPTAFHKGFGAGVYLAPLLEYRPNSMWGGMLQLGYDDRRAAFFDVPCPCGENSSLSATVSYISFEPSLRFSPFSDDFYIFGGPRIGYNFSFSSPDEKSFLFVHEGQSTTQAQFSDMRTLVFSGQIGAGLDLALTSKNAETQYELSPYVSFQPYFGQDPRSVETWAMTTVRVGVAIKFGSGDVIPHVEKAPIHEVVERDVQFSLRVPKAVPVKRRVRETFPLRNYVFFDEQSTAIPSRYELLTKEQAATFKEEQLQEVQPKSMKGRSLREMTVYYNVLNVIGDRMKRNPAVTINLSGASSQGAEKGKERAETIKRYLVTVFTIDSSRISTEGREKPKIPSTSEKGIKEIELLTAGDQRVDIESTSPEMMIQVGGPAHYSIKPVQIVSVVEDPLDSRLLIHVEGASEVLASWSLEIKDESGIIQRFGPSTLEHENISGNSILGKRLKGTYQVTLLGQTKAGLFVRKDTTIQLIRREEPKNDVVRYRILFDFDKSETLAEYEAFLTDVVAPLIPNNGIVIIHGYTDIIGEEEYNQELSVQRVADARGIIERAIAKLGKTGITFETFGFGEDINNSQFDNYFPEQRFYNRSVIIDIVPD
jgi:outer membrane protein OmpA-like peptidoglycan-associated protein